MSSARILLVFQDQSLLEVISRALLIPAEFQVSATTETTRLSQQIRQFKPDVVIIEQPLAGESLAVAQNIRRYNPAISVLLFVHENSLETAMGAIQVGITGLLVPPLKTNDLIKSVQHGLQHRQQLIDWTANQSLMDTKSLRRRLDELDAIGRVGRSMTASLNIDSILVTAVESAVELTNAEEGSLLLLDQESGELYIHAAKNIGEELVQTLRLPAVNSLAGQVIHTGEPLLYAGEGPQKLKTDYFLHSLMYVPLRTRSGIIGVLGVQNRNNKVEFTQNQLAVVSAIADYAAIAIENAQLFNDTEIERRKLNTILTKIIDGVIVVDHERKVILVNPTAREAFNISSQYLISRSIFDVVKQPDLLEIFSLTDNKFPLRREIELEDGRFFNVQATAIPEVGLALTLQDITQIKELERVKSDFVSTVSHDLRSPLTAILGYIELLERVGSLNATQKEFVQRVHMSVQNITNLINELLDLGRIEAGFDAQREFFALEKLILLAVEELRESADSKSQKILVEVPPDLPDIFASPTRIHQVLSNLIGNAVKYTQPNGWVRIRAQAEKDQLILRVQDNGPGILVSEQPYIFDRFYRATNAEETSGTGLGLAIVKSIIENHQGRIWVESTPGSGTTFTVMLPLLPGLEKIKPSKVDANSAAQD